MYAELLSELLSGELLSGVAAAALLSGVAAAAAACGGGGRDDTSADAAGGDATLEVIGGFGGGTYPVGAEVHVFADVPPAGWTMAGWTGASAAALAEPGEWHTTLVVPAGGASIEAMRVPASEAPRAITYLGGSTRAKRAFVYEPATPRGLLLLLHGTGGRAQFGASGEAQAVARRAVLDGWVVVSPEAEESVAGDRNGDGKERWDVGIEPGNVDLTSLDALVRDLRAERQLPAAAPNAAIGMSNGGAMALALGTVGAVVPAGELGALRFAAVVVHCASGRAGQAMTTRTPTLFLGCANDDNSEVDNDQISANSAAIAARGVRSEARLHPASPLYPARFTRVPGITAATSAAIHADLARHLDAGGFFTISSAELLAAVMASPASYPALAALPAAQRAAAFDQIRATRAEHQMFSDWAAYALAFIGRP